jgi:hypothetical protein
MQQAAMHLTVPEATLFLKAGAGTKFWAVPVQPSLAV